MKLNFEKINYNSISQKILVILALVISWSALVYRVYALDRFGAFLSLVLAVGSYVILQQTLLKNNASADQAMGFSPLLGWSGKLVLGSYLAAVLAGLALLLSGRSSASIISPWQVVSPLFFGCYFAATLGLIWHLSRSGKFAIPLLTLHYFLSFSVISIVYQLGYGFDGFIHEATLGLIDKQGFVDPKPFYYLGQYGLVIILHKFLFIPIAWLNKLLVPVIAALFLPGSLMVVFKKISGRPPVVALLALSLPFSFLTFSTPQNLTYLMLVLCLLYGLLADKRAGLVLPALLALASASIHPIAGLAALLFVGLLFIEHSGLKGYRWPKAAIFTVTAIILPLLFFVFEGGRIDLAAFDLASLLSFDWLKLPGQENFIINAAYLYAFNLKFMLLFLIGYGSVLYFRAGKKIAGFTVCLLMAPALYLSYLLTRFLPFSFLIDYERSDYAERILLLSMIFSSPIIMLALSDFINRSFVQEKIIRRSFGVIAALLITASLYASYPRFDQYFNSRGYSSGNFDIEAVEWIEKQAAGDYIVLANQQVSAAALHQFGFARYYKDNVFYYPVPTGGPLYQLFLQMVYDKPSRETTIKAMDLAGVNQAYFVLNKYWYAFPKVLEEAKLEADSWQEFGSGQVFVFTYKR